MSELRKRASDRKDVENDQEAVSSSPRAEAAGIPVTSQPTEAKGADGRPLLTASEWKSEDSDEDAVKRDRYAEFIASQPSAQSAPSADNLLNHVLAGLSTKWRNYVIRSLFTFLMIAGFGLLVWMGPLALFIVTLMVQVKCYQEIINIGYLIYRVHNLPWFRSLSWYFLLTSNYFFYGESMVDYFSILLHKTDAARPLVTYHRFISFLLYIVGFVWFVLSLVKKYYFRQFALFAWTHVTLLIVVTQSYLILQNVFEGLIWFIIPVSMIVCNDVFAYLFGFFFGKTPLIKLSPKKTWEGFIGGGFATVIFGLTASYFMCQYKYFVCPIRLNEELRNHDWNCTPTAIFQLQQYHLPNCIHTPLKILHLPIVLTWYPFMFHSLSLSLFSSVIGPFGGFFASGFKRAVKIKDFGDVIPGHGGIVDRFDCQFLMATFVNVYISSFIKSTSPARLIQSVFYLSAEEQLQVYFALRKALIDKGILGPHDNEPPIMAADQ